MRGASPISKFMSMPSSAMTAVVSEKIVDLEGSTRLLGVEKKIGYQFIRRGGADAKSGRARMDGS